MAAYRVGGVAYLFPATLETCTLPESLRMRVVKKCNCLRDEVIPALTPPRPGLFEGVVD